MDRDGGLRVLGLRSRASADEVRRAYKQRARSVKTLLLGSLRADELKRHRDELRELVQAREAALGRNAGDWRSRALGKSGRTLIDRLRTTRLDSLDRGGARAFFELAPEATDDDVVTAYRARARSLIRRFAAARNDAEMVAVRRARGKLRTIRNFAIAASS